MARADLESLVTNDDDNSHQTMDIRMYHEEYNEGVMQLPSLHSCCSLQEGEASSAKNIDSGSSCRQDELEQSGTAKCLSRKPFRSIDEYISATASTENDDIEGDCIELLSLHSSVCSLVSLLPSNLHMHEAYTRTNKSQIAHKEERDARSMGQIQRTISQSRNDSIEKMGLAVGDEPRQQENPNIDDSMGFPGEDEIQWVCDSCRTAVFSNILEAQDHENICRFMQQHSSSSREIANFRGGQNENLPARGNLYQDVDNLGRNGTEQHEGLSLQMGLIGSKSTHLAPRISSLSNEISILVEATEARDEQHKDASRSDGSFRRDNDSLHRADALKFEAPMIFSHDDALRKHELSRDGHPYPIKDLSSTCSYPITKDSKKTCEKDDEFVFLSEPRQEARYLAGNFNCRKIADKWKMTVERQLINQLQGDPPRKMEVPSTSTDNTRRVPSLSSLKIDCRKISEKQRDLVSKHHQHSKRVSQAKAVTDHPSGPPATDSILQQPMSKHLEDNCKKWICDSCEVAKFKSYAACYIHEKVCNNRRLNNTAQR